MKCILVCNVAFSPSLVHLRDEASPPRSSGLPNGKVLGTLIESKLSCGGGAFYSKIPKREGDSRSGDEDGTGNANAVTAESSNSHWGPYIKDVRTVGDWPKSRHSKGGCVNLVLQINPKFGQGGLKIPKLADVLNVCSLELGYLHLICRSAFSLP